jgi:hypothetical protein
MPDPKTYRDAIQYDSSRPALSEVARARPSRGSGAPARCSSHKAAILALLRERGPAGILSSELYDAPERYGRSPRNRISELRREGCLIEGSARGSSDWFYRLIRDKDGIASAPKPEPAKPQPLKSWEQVCAEREEKMRQSAPSFELTP